MGEDLLGNHPNVVCYVGEAAKVATWIGQPIWMVDPESVDNTPSNEPRRQLMRGVEDLRQLNSNGYQRVDIEEAPVVELLVGNSPECQPVVLSRQQLLERKLLRALSDW